MGKRIDLTGQRFGRLTVLNFSHVNKGKAAMWNSKCDCGNVKVILGTDLRLGNSLSCGCLRKEITSERFGRHGNAKYDRVVRYIKQGRDPWEMINKYKLS